MRFKLQRKSSQQGFAGQKGSGVRDLREMLSGTMHAQPSNADAQKGKQVAEIVKATRRKNADERPVRQTKKVSKPSSSKKTSQPKVGILLVIHSFPVSCFPLVPEFSFDARLYLVDDVLD